MSEVLIIDDHPLIRDAVRRVFEHGNEWVVSDAGTYEEALDRMVHEPMPDLVLPDIGLPGKFGLDALIDFREKFPETPCVVLSGQDEQENVHGAIDLGGRFQPVPRARDRVLALYREEKHRHLAYRRISYRRAFASSRSKR